MSLPYEFRVFVSYAREQRATVEHLLVELRTEGISAWWDRDIPPGNAWREILDEKIRYSRHLLLYWNIEAKASEMVNHEILTFLDDAKGDPSRTLFILLAPNCDKKHVPENLGEVQHVAAISEVVIHILKEERAELDGRLREAAYKSKRERDELEDLLGKERSKVAEARKYYEHRRFWGSFAENKDVHVFTCGRDIQPDATRPRGTSGFRTNIDKWDYRAVLAITHYFASHYPGTTLTIEDPESKLQQQDIQEPHALASRIAEVGTILHDKDCIIIGSPDVNDFAEIVLSRIHQIYPYDNKRKKSRGFVLIRNSKSTASAFYWQTATDEREGIARLGPSKHIYAYEPPDPAAGASATGVMHGIMVVADNPFHSAGTRRRVMILSGFSGVATHAMAKFLTERAFLSSFFKFDEAQSQQNGAIEALVSVKYIEKPGVENRDAREIDQSDGSIAFEELVAV